MAFKEIRNVVHRTYRPPEKPTMIVDVTPPIPPSQKKDPSLSDGSWKRENDYSVNREYPLVNSVHIKKLLDIV